MKDITLFFTFKQLRKIAPFHVTTSHFETFWEAVLQHNVLIVKLLFVCCIVDSFSVQVGVVVWFVTVEDKNNNQENMVSYISVMNSESENTVQ